MCGIVAASGPMEVQDEVVAALARVQYRGYDSFGFAWVSDAGDLETARSTEADAVHETHLPASRTVLGHTRWATHGAVNLANCHPHVSKRGEFALVHNGIVTNFDALMGDSDVHGSDTALIVRLLEQVISQGVDRLQALKQTADQLVGRNTIVVLFSDGEILAYRKGSPLVVGKGESTGLYLASDQLAFSCTCAETCRIEDDEYLCIQADRLLIYTSDLQERSQQWLPVTEHYQAADKDGHRHFMQKEILEQWQSVPQVLPATETADFARAVDLLKHANRIVVVGAGGAHFTGRQIAYLLRHEANLNAIDVQAYEFDNFQSVMGRGDVLIAVSQSGETADTLYAIEVAKARQLSIISILNVPGSTMAELSDVALQQCSGPEICVLSTKSATAQITLGYCLAMAVANQLVEARRHIQTVSHLLAVELSDRYLARCQHAARQIVTHQSVYVLGHNEGHAAAQIAALNIKEASYIHAEAFSSGELKHGVLALITDGVPVIVIVPKGDPLMRQVIAEVKARGAYVIGLLADESCLSACDDYVMLPAAGSILTALIPGQLLAYYAAVALGLDPDRPRNLAKSITVM